MFRSTVRIVKPLSNLARPSPIAPRSSAVFPTALRREPTISPLCSEPLVPRDTFSRQLSSSKEPIKNKQASSPEVLDSLKLFLGNTPLTIRQELLLRTNCYTTDRVRVKDLSDSLIIIKNIQNEHEPIFVRDYIRFYLFILLSGATTSAVLLMRARDQYDQELYGETPAQHSTRKAIKKICDQLGAIKPEDYGTMSFTPDEHQMLEKCKLDCHTANLVHEKIYNEMAARRASGYKNPRFFGDIWIPGIREANMQPPLLTRVQKSIDSIRKRVASEEEASKEQVYQEIISTRLGK